MLHISPSLSRGHCRRVHFRSRRQHSSTQATPHRAMKTIAAAAALCTLAPAAAFVPGGVLPRVRSSTPSSLSMMATPEKSVAIPIDPYPEGLDGEMVGDFGFDPAGFANNPPAWVQGEGTGTAARVKWYREAELAHCRVAMLAAAGWVFPEIYHLPGNTVLGADRFAEMNPLLAFDNIPTSGNIQIFITLHILESIRLNRAIRNPDGVPGDIGLGQGEGRWNPFGFNYTEEQYKEKQLQELKNGRVAMIAITGMYFQTLVQGKPILAQLTEAFSPVDAVSKAGYYFNPL